jgi:hypothetical protein
VLAKLDKIEGVAHSRVDWTGRTILIHLENSADADTVAAQAGVHLGLGSTRLPRSREADCVESFRRGDPWLRAGQTLELSRRESKVLGKSLAVKAGGSILHQDDLGRLESILEEELFALFSRIHAGEFTLQEALQKGAAESGPRLRNRLHEFLSEDQAESVLNALRREIFGSE